MFSALKNGYIAEQQFIVEAMKNDLTVSKPISNTEPYDFVVEHNSRLIRVQVKKAYIVRPKRYAAALRSSNNRNNRSYVADSDRVDYMALHCAETDIWYIIPHHVISHLRSSVILCEDGKYASYINNWNFE